MMVWHSWLFLRQQKRVVGFNDLWSLTDYSGDTQGYVRAYKRYYTRSKANVPV